MTTSASDSSERLYKWTALAIAGSGVFMVTLDSGMVNVALPTITTNFGQALATGQWVTLAYTLCVTGLLLPAGRLSDIYGRRRLFLGGFVLFALGSLLSGLAPSFELLIAAGIVKGIGGAMIQSNSAGIIAQAFPIGQRGQALGLNGAIVSAGLLSGPAVGGLIVSWLGWSWVFYINVPIGIVALAFGLWRLREPATRPGQRFDLAGAILFLVLIVTTMLALNFGGRQGLTPLVLALAGITAVVAAAFVLVERCVAQPTLEFSLYAIPAFRAATASAFCSFLGVSGVQLLMPFYLQHVLHLPPGHVGLILVTTPATILVLGPLAGMLSDRFGSRLLATAGLLIAAVGLLSMATLGSKSSVLDVIPRLALMAVGTGIFNSPNSSALFGALPRDRYGVAGAYQSLTRNLGQAVGQTLSAALWTIAIVQAAGGLPVESAPVDAVVVGFRTAFLCGGAIIAAGALISFYGRPRTATTALAAEAVSATGSR